MGSGLVEYVVGSLARANLADVECVGVPACRWVEVTSSVRLCLNLQVDSNEESVQTSVECKKTDHD